MKKAVVLFSGGLDSTTVAAKVLADGFDVYALSFDYGQRHSIELDAAKRIAQRLNFKDHKVIPLSLGAFGGSALTQSDIDVPAFQADSNDIPVTYVPARNILFLSYALAYAEVIGANDIFIGASAIDYSGYPDCRPEFFEAYQHMANVGTKAGVEGPGVVIQTPLINLSKAQTIALGKSLGVDYSQTVSCYQANEQGEACGKCDSCALRKKGFVDAGLDDVTRYSL